MIAREYRNQLDQHPSAWHVTGHRRKQAIRIGGRNPRRHRRLPRGELPKGIGERIYQCIDVEESLDIGPRQ
jgi:hypothetical protein